MALLIKNIEGMVRIGVRFQFFVLLARITWGFFFFEILNPVRNVFNSNKKSFEFNSDIFFLKGVLYRVGVFRVDIRFGLWIEYE